MKNGIRNGLIAGSCVLIAGAAGILLSFDKPGNNDMVTVKPDSRLQYKWYSPELPKSISFAGEPAPLDRWDVRDQLDRELNINYYLHGTTLYIIKNTTRYFPLIEAKLSANGIPDDFKYLCVAESALQHATSKAGAVGFWQFMKDTGIRYGLEINDEVDERYNVSKATDAACKYFKEAYGKFGSWTAAAASYNCGVGGYSSYASYQKTNNYYDLFLPDETMRYVSRILALKYLISGASQLGYIVTAQDAYHPYKTKSVTVTNTIADLAEYASANGTNYRMLKILNPWLRGHTLTVKEGKSYELELPG